MPPKARLDDESFQKALAALDSNQLSQLENSSTIDPIWGYVCNLMSKANNPENRRACYDAYNRKRIKIQPLLKYLVEENALQSNKQRIISSPTMSSTDQTRIAINKTAREHMDSCTSGAETKRNINDTKIGFNRPTASTSMETSTDSLKKNIGETTVPFMRQLRELVAQHDKSISIIEIHDHYASLCTGTIISIQVTCECSKTHNRRKDTNESSTVTDLPDSVDRDLKTNNEKKKQTSSLIELDSLKTPQSRNETDEINDECFTASPSFQLHMSPASSVSIDVWPKNNHDDNELPVEDKSVVQSVSRIFSQVKSILSPKKSNDHSILDEEQHKTLELLQRRDGEGSYFSFKIEEVRRLEKENPAIVSQTHMNILKEDKEKEFEARDRRKKLGKTNKNDVEYEKQRRNMRWTVIFDTYIRKSNGYCVFIYEDHHFSISKRIPKANDFFMSFDAHCKFTKCTCVYHAVLQHDGHLKINYSGTIMHNKTEVHARPIRDERREEIQQLTNLGVTPGSLYLHQLSKMSNEEKVAGNRNTVGSSPSVIRKISSEGNVKLRRHEDLQASLQNLKAELEVKIFPGEAISGYLQEISVDPLRLICFTAGGIAAYHQFSRSMPLSWDATGSVVITREKKTYYYELTMSNIKRGGPSLPITVMLTESHTAMDIVHWMNCFIEKYKQIFGYAQQFPKPPVIHSDRATVFLLAGIQIFNQDETMARYLERCWRIVKRIGTPLDIQITVVHACLGHFMKNVKKNASKDLTKKQVPFGMWLMALLVNSNTLEEMTMVWKHICTVLLSPTQNIQFKVSISILSKMANEMNQDPDKTNFVLEQVSVTSKGQIDSQLPEEDEEDDELNYDIALGQEDAVLSSPSSFKELFCKIYRESNSLIKEYDAPHWNVLPSNPLFSAVFLQRLLKLYMPFAPIWSNLLLGNFSQRYGYSSTQSNNSSCSCHYGRTTGVSESQMRVLKEAVLKNKVYSRVDQVISRISENIEAIEIQFADHALNPKIKMRILPTKKQKPAEEIWSKRRKTKRPTGIYTSEKPPMDLITMMHKRLLEEKDDEKLNAGQLQQFLRFENQQNNCWLNAVLQMILASGNIVDTFRRSDGIDIDFMSMTVISVTSMLTNLIKKQDRANTNPEKTIVKSSYIIEHINYLRAAGLNLRPGTQHCLFDFFDSSIVPNFLYHGIEHQIILELSMECSSCKKDSIIDHQYWHYLLVPQTSSQQNVLRTIGDLFGLTSQKKSCPKCLSDDDQETFLSVLSCPRNLFLRFDPRLTTGNIRTKLMHHMDIAEIVNKKVVNTPTYSRYILQSFIVFYGIDAQGHFVTYAQKQGEWYRLDDTNISLVQSLNVFGDHDDSQPVILAHYTRPLNDDIFSIALWNVFTDFAPLDQSLSPTLSLNDALALFAKINIIENNPLNLVVIKFWACSKCRTENFVIERFADIFEMKYNGEHISDSMLQFFHKEILCSSCKHSGLSRSLLYDMPRYLVLYRQTDDVACINLINEVDLITIGPSLEIPKFDYSADTILIVLERNEMFYLRKEYDGFVYYDTVKNRFEPLRDISTHQISLSTSWIVFIYKTSDDIFASLKLERTIFDGQSFREAIEPDLLSIETVQQLLPTFKEPFDVGSITMEKKNLTKLLEDRGDLNDLLIDAYLSQLASFGSGGISILALPVHHVSQIIEKRLKNFDITWLQYDLILCPINQHHHWYLIIIDRRKEIVIEIDSMLTLELPRRRNIDRLLRVLELQHRFKDESTINLGRTWRYCAPLQDMNIQQDDNHACGVNILMHAKAYIEQRHFSKITTSNVRAYRHQLLENILRTAMPLDLDCDKSHTEIMQQTEMTIQQIRKTIQTKNH